VSFSYEDRRSQLETIDGKSFDLVVIGGGISGAGIAHEAAFRGLRVALLEKGDIASGTSSASSKLIHGGLRYLEQIKFGLVAESVRERQLLLELAPELVWPIDFVLPTYRDSKHSARKMRLGMWIYQRLAGRHRIGRPRHLGPEEFAELEPALRQDGLVQACIYQDCQTNDARLTLAAAKAAYLAGAAVLPRCEVTGAERDGESVARLCVTDLLSGQAFKIGAAQIVLAAGPWTDQVVELLGLSHPQLVRRTRGVHICIPVDKAPVTRAVAISHPQDGRAMFILPWGKTHTVVGTTDTDHEGTVEGLQASREDAEYLLVAYNRYCPAHPLGLDDIVSSWTGLRPLVYEPGKPPSKVSREHLIKRLAPNLTVIVGGKLTTFRAMAHEVVEGLGLDLALPRAPEPYPTAPEPTGVEDVDRTVDEELCLSVTDYLRRRTLMFYKAPDQGLEVVEAVGARLAERLGWDSDQTAAEVAAYRAEVAASRAFRD